MLRLLNRLQPNRGGADPFGFVTRMETSSISMPMCRLKIALKDVKEIVRNYFRRRRCQMLAERVPIDSKEGSE